MLIVKEIFRKLSCVLDFYEFPICLLMLKKLDQIKFLISSKQSKLKNFLFSVLH